MTPEEITAKAREWVYNHSMELRSYTEAPVRVFEDSAKASELIAILEGRE